MSIDHCWLQLTAGRGPAECQLTVVKLAEKIVKTATKNGVEAETIELVEGERKGTALSALVSICGENAVQFASQWIGTVLWICESPYRPNHRRKNWFVGVQMITPLTDDNIDIDQRDLKIETFRASGPGGQHVNTTDSAVRVKHTVSGITVVASAERSQLMNKKLAIARLVERLQEVRSQQNEDAKKDIWAQHNDLERGNPVKMFTGMKFQEKLR